MVIPGCISTVYGSKILLLGESDHIIVLLNGSSHATAGSDLMLFCAVGRSTLDHALQFC
jgi:hypothetical protein